MPKQIHVSLQVQMPPEMHASLSELAGKRGVSEFVRQLVQKEIDKASKKKKRAA